LLLCHLTLRLLLLLQSLQASGNEALVGSWPGKHTNAVDAALPFFHGRPIRTSSNLSNMGSAGVHRTASFSGPASARAAMSMTHEGSFVADQLCFSSCNSAPITPRSPGFGYGEEVKPRALSQYNSSCSSCSDRTAGQVSTCGCWWVIIAHLHAGPKVAVLTIFLASSEC